jgi:hypothetical protein
MKNLILLITLFAFLILISVIIQAQELVEDNLDVETSIVLLTLFDINREKVYAQDDFFEIFYFSEEDYILLPANLIAPYLEVELNFNRDLSLLTIEKERREVRIDLTTKTYLEHPEWDERPPVIAGGEFYLAKEVFEYLTDYQISWNNSLQEVVVEGEFFEDVEIEDGLEEEEKEKIIYQESEKDILGDEIKSFQLSSVHYRVQLNLEDRVFGDLNKEINGDLNFYGRTGNWAYYLNNDLKYDIDNSEVDYELDRIKFKYQENNMLIIAGDHDFRLEETMGSNEMQGLYFSLPDRLSYKLIPYTNVTIEVKKGDQISLYLNDNLLKRRDMKFDGEYTFENIELRARYLNKIEVVNLNSEGEEKRQLSYLVGSNDILNSEVRETEIFTGRYRDDDYSGDGWEGYFGALRGNYALNRRLSAHIETAIYNESLNPDTDLTEEVVSSITGFSFKINSRTVINLDWLIAGEFDSLESGAEAEILYGLLNGYIQGVYLYIPPETADYMEKDEGEDKSLSFKLDLGNNVSINPTIGQQKTLEADTIDESDYYNFKIIYNPSWRNYNALSLYYEDNTSEYSFTDINDQIYIFLGDKIRKGIGLENNIYGNTFRVSSDLGYYDNEITISNFYSENYQDYEAEIGLYKRFGNYLLLSANYDGEQRRDDQGTRYYDREYDGEIRLSFGRRASLSLGTKRNEEESEDRIDEESNLRLNYYFNREFSLTAELKDYHSEFLSDYQSVSLSGSYYYPDNPGYIRLSGEYIVPDEGDPGASFSAAYDIIRDDESEIKIEVGRDYSDFVNNGYESYATVSYSHAFSFIEDETRKSRFTDFEPRPIVAGYAYLDENYNGIMDPGERKLEDIPMRLGNMLAVSDSDGFFIFKPYFNDTYFLNFDYRNLIADYTPVTEEILVRVKDNQNVMQNFGVTINGTISGNVFIDKNANGVKDENDDYLMWAGMEVAGLNKKDYTDQTGEYYFQNVPLGFHELTLLKESLPKGTRPLNGYTQEIFITEDQLDHHGIDIPIVYGD